MMFPEAKGQNALNTTNGGGLVLTSHRVQGSIHLKTCLIFVSSIPTTFIIIRDHEPYPASADVCWTESRLPDNSIVDSRAEVFA